jgi:hypothetical protein
LSQARAEALLAIGDMKELETQMLDIQDDIGHILPDPVEGGKLVKNPFHPYGRDRRALERREEDSAQRVADGNPEPALQALGMKSPVGVRVSSST